MSVQSGLRLFHGILTLRIFKVRYYLKESWVFRVHNQGAAKPWCRGSVHRNPKKFCAKMAFLEGDELEKALLGFVKAQDSTLDPAAVRSLQTFKTYPVLSSTAAINVV